MTVSIAAAGLVFSALIATAYGAAFHFFVGGPLRTIPVYLIAAWLGFALGHFIGASLDVTLLRLGVVQLLPASLGAWLLLVIARWFLHND